MKYLYKFLAFAVLYFIFSFSLFGQWEKISGPSKTVSSIAANDSNIYASGNGIFRSTDNGKSWFSISNGLPERYIVTMTNYENKIYVGFDFDSVGVYISTNNGSSWLPTGFRDTLSTSRTIQSIFVNKTNIYLGTSDGMFTSSDNGESWVNTNDSLIHTNIKVITKKDTFLYAGTQTGIFRSVDSGKSWKASNNGLTNFNVTSLAIKDNMIFAGTWGAGVFYSTNNGSNWIPTDNNIQYPLINNLLIKDTLIFIGTSNIGNGIYESGINNIRWSPVDSSLFQYRSILSLASNKNIIFAGASVNGGGGIYRSIDNGLTWSAASITQSYTGPFAIIRMGTDSPVIYVGSGDGVFLSKNNGESWQNAGLSKHSVMCFAEIDSGIYAGTFRDGVFLSTDGGNAWQNVSNGLTSSNVYILGVFSLAVNKNMLFAATEIGVFRSTDFGLNWSPTKLNTYSFNLCESGSKLFTATLSREMFFSEDNGDNWVSIETPSGHVINTFRVFSNLNNTDILAGTEKGIYFSSDYGNSWKLIGLSDYYIQSICGNRDTLFATTNDIENNLFFSKDSGNTWVKISDGLSNRSVFDVVILNNYALAATSDGVWHRHLTDLMTNIGNKNNLNVNEYYLEQNYPNPFNPNTTINYSIPKRYFVKIKIYDILGREIQTLVNEEEPAGHYKVNFNASKYSSGVYFYQLKTRDFISTKKMILLK